MQTLPVTTEESQMKQKTHVARKGKEHWRVVIQLIHIKTATDQPEILAYSLPGFNKEHTAEVFYNRLCDISDTARLIARRTT